jgi:hypothetical protein
MNTDEHGWEETALTRIARIIANQSCPFGIRDNWRNSRLLLFIRVIRVIRG